MYFFYVKVAEIVIFLIIVYIMFCVFYTKGFKFNE